MTEETTATPAGGEDTHVDASDAPALEANAPETPVAAVETPAEDLSALIPEEPEDEYEEVERGDKKYRIPKALKGELLMHQDYTQKTMTLAEQRRALDAEKAAVEQAKTLTADERRAWVRVEGLSDQVAAYEKVDWDALEANDPQEAARHWRLYQTAQGERTKLATALEQHRQQTAYQAQQDFAKRRAERDEQVAKEIPNWSAKRPELEQFAARYGYTPEGLAENAGVNDYKLLHLAHEGFKFIERQRAAAKAAAGSNIKPVPEVGGTAAAGVDPSSLSMEAYIAARKSGTI